MASGTGDRSGWDGHGVGSRILPGSEIRRGMRTGLVDGVMLEDGRPSVSMMEGGLFRSARNGPCVMTCRRRGLRFSRVSDYVETGEESISTSLGDVDWDGMEADALMVSRCQCCLGMRWYRDVNTGGRASSRNLFLISDPSR